MPHCAGRKSFARYREEKTINGVEPSRATIFIETHKDRKTKEKRPIDEESARAVELMKIKLNELHGGAEENGGQIAWKGDIYDQVINKPERYGQVRGVGLGPCPSRLWGNQSTINQSNRGLPIDDVSNEAIEKVIEQRMKVIEEKHRQEITLMQEKNDNIINKMLDRQSLLERNISKLVSILIEKATNEEESIESGDNIYGR